MKYFFVFFVFIISCGEEVVIRHSSLSITDSGPESEPGPGPGPVVPGPVVPGPVVPGHELTPEPGQSSESGVCKKLDYFNTNVKTKIVATCGGCHTATHAKLKIAGQTDANLCKNVIARANLSSIEESDILLFPLNSDSIHKGRTVFSSTEDPLYSAIKLWIKEEAGTGGTGAGPVVPVVVVPGPGQSSESGVCKKLGYFNTNVKTKIVATCGVCHHANHALKIAGQTDPNLCNN